MDAKQMNPKPLIVTIMSFSFKNPPDWGSYPHGGGFVFDCRAIPNPGREDRYKHLTGLDLPVQEYLLNTSEFEQFFKASAALVEQAVDHHQRRGFEQLVVAYGCTGGQHRSVFSALRLAELLEDRVATSLEHRESANWPNLSKGAL